MIIFCDEIAFAQRCIPQSDDWDSCKVSALPSPVAALANELFDSGSIMRTEIAASEHWNYLFAVDRANNSQYDVLSRLATSGCELPDKTLCCAATGDEFHGFKGRDWKTCRGNIHLSAFVKPAQEIQGAAVGFMIAAVIACLQTVESFELQDAVPAIKWVNDVLVQGAKVGGVLARLQTQGPVTESAVVGIGLNVEKRPPVERNPYAPKVAALSDFTGTPTTFSHADALTRLMEFLGCNLKRLCQGQFYELLDIYRQHSLILGRQVTICEDTHEGDSRVLVRGLVESIGPSLELFIRNYPNPVTKGRLQLENYV